MMVWFLLFYFVHLPLHAQVKVSADTVDYDGKQTILGGNVLIDHAMGKMSAHEAYLFRLPGRDQSVSMFRLEGGVEIALRDGALLECEIAEFNSQDKTGLFHSGSSDVTYQTQRIDQSGASSPITLHSKEMRIRLGDQLEELVATHDVRIQYDRDVTALTDNLWYDPSGNGTFHLIPDEGKLCRIDTAAGDQIRAKQIHLRNHPEQITFDKADGELALKQKEQVHFSADTLTWERKRQKLTMVGNVAVHQEGMGNLTSADRVSVELEEGEMGRQLRQMQSHGKTTLSLIDETSGETSLITCYGLVHVDHQALTTTFSSPRSNGRVVSDLRVTYSDRMGQVTANEIVLCYQNEKPKPTLSKLTLEGDVYLVNDAPWDPGANKPVLQYALADRVEYDPLTRQMTMTATAPHRVLYFDQINSVQVSAPALEAWRDGATGEDALRGKGDVRFSLLDHEIDQMRRLFQIHDAVSKSHEA